MTVKELITKLKDCEGDAVVLIGTNRSYYEFDGFSEQEMRYYRGGPFRNGWFESKHEHQKPVRTQNAIVLW